MCCLLHWWGRRMEQGYGDGDKQGYPRLQSRGHKSRLIMCKFHLEFHSFPHPCRHCLLNTFGLCELPTQRRWPHRQAVGKSAQVRLGEGLPLLLPFSFLFCQSPLEERGRAVALCAHLPTEIKSALLRSSPSLPVRLQKLIGYLLVAPMVTLLVTSRN